MNYSHIELILEIAEAGAISKAAENLYISQPSLSAILKSIESEIGTPLFRRSKAGVELTPFGKIYIQYAKDISDQIQTLNNLYKSQQVSPLTFSVVSEGFRFLNDALFEIRQKFIGTACTFHISEAPHEKQIQHVKSGDYEVGILTVQNSHRKTFLRELRANGLEYSRLQDTTLGIYVSKNSKTFPASITQIDKSAIHLLMDMPYITIHARRDDLSEHRFQTSFASLAKKHKLEIKNPIITNHSGMKIDMVTKYDGFCEATYCPSLYEKYKFYDGIRFIPYAPEYNELTELGWIQRQNQPRSPLINELVQMLAE